MKLLHIRWAVLLTALCLLLTACGQKAETNIWQEQYDLGIRYLEEGNYAEAILAFTAAIEIDPKQGDSYLALADVYISTGDYEAAAAILQQGRQAGLVGDSQNRFEEAAARYDSILEFLSGGTDGIRITNLRFDKESYLAGEPTRFLVSVAYHCPEDEACIVMIGANTEEPGSFRMLEEDYAVTGGGGYQFDVTVTPRQWDGQPFGIYVNLSEADHGESWTPLGSDTLYLDGEGNVTGSFDLEEDPSGADQPEPGVPAQTVGTLSLENFTYSFDPDSGVTEYNEGAVGGIELNFTVNGPSNVRGIYIAAWREDPFTQEEREQISFNMAELWKQESMEGVDRIPPFESSGTFPVDPEERGTMVEVLLVGLDENGDVAGYTTETVAIP